MVMWQSQKTGRLRLHRKEDGCIYKAQDQAEDRHLSAEMNTGAWRGHDNEDLVIPIKLHNQLCINALSTHDVALVFHEDKLLKQL